MKKLKITAGIIWAFLGLILIIALFPGLTSLSKSLADMPFMKINPNYTGGEIAKQIVMPSCTLDIRKPVFDGLLKERNHGFVQIDWHGNIPDIIEDTIDYDLDSHTDFYVKIDTRTPKTELKPLNPGVKDINTSTPTSYGWALRVNLKKIRSGN
jgi:hypothetical protein